jgi:hypothetical protein
LGRVVRAHDHGIDRLSTRAVGQRLGFWGLPRGAESFVDHCRPGASSDTTLDGRDPSSYAGIAWVFGRYDRAWGPERPVYGKVRTMSSQNAVRKLKLREYLARYAA